MSDYTAARWRVLQWTSGSRSPVGSLPQRSNGEPGSPCLQCGAAVADWPAHDAWHDAVEDLMRACPVDDDF